jgi:hypothetical protein
VMTRSVPVGRRSTQLVVALCLISAIVIVSLVVLFAMRGAIAQDIHNILTVPGAFVTKSSSLAPSAMAAIRYAPCGVSLGPC